MKLIKWEPSLRATKWALRVCVFLILFITITCFTSLELIFTHFGWLQGDEDALQFLPLFVSAVISLPIGALLTTLMLHFPLKPVNKLLQGMKRLASGHFEERLHFKRSTGLNEIADTFNTLASELQNTEMLRSDFVNNFSHEFKTPIVSVRGFAKLLQRDDLTAEQRHEYLDIIVDETTRLANMATNVLNLTRLENQSILSSVTRFNLSEQLRRCILLMEKKWTAKQLLISADFSEHMISGDAELLKEVWVNLLDNAVKFSPEGAEIKVEIRHKLGQLDVSFTNHGPEIAPDEQKRLFDKFWQSDSSHAAEGTGIGLSLVKRIVELHKGKVSVESDPAQTIFHVILPELPR
ncbi:MAG: HAMP domain-containing histidine kinase [Clostridia bacterium]|nr:HAMP domain-containing histidine kinase [Clostridia bacterium]